MKHFYLRNSVEFPVACVALEVFDHVDGSYVKFAVATFNPKDNFNLERMREIAQSRLEVSSKKTYTFGLPIGPRTLKPELMRVIISRVNSDNPTGFEFPKRTRDAARLWLEQHQPQNPSTEAAHGDAGAGSQA